MTEIALLRRLVRESCQAWDGGVEVISRNDNGTQNVRFREPGEEGWARLALDESFRITDPAELAILKELLG